MDIRFEKMDIFDQTFDAIVYFSKNDLLGADFTELFKHTSEKIEESFISLGAIPTGVAKLVPAQDLKADYLILSVIPEDLDTNRDIYLFESALNAIFDLVEKYQLSEMAIDVEQLKNNYGQKYVNILNRLIHQRRRELSDFVLHLCQ